MALSAFSAGFRYSAKECRKGPISGWAVQNGRDRRVQLGRSAVLSYEARSADRLGSGLPASPTVPTAAVSTFSLRLGGARCHHDSILHPRPPPWTLPSRISDHRSCRLPGASHLLPRRGVPWHHRNTYEPSITRISHRRSIHNKHPRPPAGLVGQSAG